MIHSTQPQTSVPRQGLSSAAEDAEDESGTTIMPEPTVPPTAPTVSSAALGSSAEDAEDESGTTIMSGPTVPSTALGS